MDREMMKLLLVDDTTKLLQTWLFQGEQQRRFQALKAFLATGTDAEMDRIIAFYDRLASDRPRNVVARHVAQRNLSLPTTGGSMAPLMNATQAKSALQGAGMPEHVMQSAEAKGIPLSALWQLVATLQPLLQNDLPILWRAISDFIAAWHTGSAPA